MKPQQLLYHNVHNLITAHNITIKQLSDNLKHIPYPTVRKWFSRKGIPLKHKETIKRYLSIMLHRNVSDDELLNDNDFIDITVRLKKKDFYKLQKITNGDMCVSEILSRWIEDRLIVM